MPLDTALIEALLAPIAPDRPGGDDLRYDPRYDEIREARREDPDLGGADDGARKLADWPATEAGIRTLLAEGTKDLQLAAWLAEALLKRRGAAGFATGLAIVRGLLEQHWDHLYPAVEEEEDIELRAGPLEWLGTRLDVAVRQIPVAADVSAIDYQLSRSVPSESEAEASDDKREQRDEAVASGRRTPEEVDALVASVGKPFLRGNLAEIDLARTELDALEKASDERFGRDAPAFTQTRKALEDARRVAAALLAARLEVDPDPEAEVAEAGGEDGAPSEGDGTVPVEPTSPADAANRIAAAARFLRRADSTNPAPYLLLRGFRWGELRAALDEIDPRLLEAPPTAARTKLKSLLLDGRWAELLDQGEELMARAHGRGWLDLQRYALTACQELGEGYDPVAAAIRGELRALLAAFPALPAMTLMDDTPTANEETRAWLEEQGLVADGRTAGDDTGTDAPAADEDDADTDASDVEEATEDVLDDALAEDAATAEHGGLARARPVRRRAGTRTGPARRDPFAMARQELAARRPNRAIELLVAELARERSARGRHVRQTQIAWVMVEAGLDAVARPILEKLVETIDERTLEDWESGPLLAQPMALLCRVYRRLDVHEDRRWELYLRVCRLDPLQALMLESS